MMNPAPVFHNIVAMLKVDFRRAFLSFSFLLTVALVVLVSYLSISLEAAVVSEASVLYYFEIFALQGLFYLVIFGVGTIPYGQSFCADWKNQFLQPIIIRSSKNLYAISKIITVGASTFAAITLGYLLALFSFAIYTPLIDQSIVEMGWNGIALPPFGFLIDINPILYLIIRIFIVALACSFWAIFALFVSSYIPNSFVVCAAPVITYYSLSILPLPVFLRLNIITQAYLDMGGIGVSLLYTVFFFFGLSSVFGWLFCRNIKRRLDNG
jgi:hypothetical protein